MIQRVYYSTAKGRSFYGFIEKVDYSKAKGKLSYGLIERVYHFTERSRGFIDLRLVGE